MGSQGGRRRGRAPQRSPGPPGTSPAGTPGLPGESSVKEPDELRVLEPWRPSGSAPRPSRLPGYPCPPGPPARWDTCAAACVDWPPLPRAGRRAEQSREGRRTVGVGSRCGNAQVRGTGTCVVGLLPPRYQPGKVHPGGVFFACGGDRRQSWRPKCPGREGLRCHPAGLCWALGDTQAFPPGQRRWPGTRDPFPAVFVGLSASGVVFLGCRVGGDT